MAQKQSGRRAGSARRDGRKGRRKKSRKATTISLSKWFARIRNMHDKARAKGAAQVDDGACLVKDPRTGQLFCILTTPDACRALKGTFSGGPCG